MIPALDTLADLGEPFEILDLPDGGAMELLPIRWELGRGLIHPRDGRPAHNIPVLRLHVAPADKPTEPRWWDVTAKTLIAGLLGYLEAPGGRRFRFIIVKTGVAPTARFTLDARPA